ncbi:hypothetical protein AAH991_37905 [Microbispora sp. ZYX-F-249]|uniref:Uncharacterized protein n=1 Tax=Microbispora maris TaxID=3144104 RepID=A0ABV0B095_9ACTN
MTPWSARTAGRCRPGGEIQADAHVRPFGDEETARMACAGVGRKP